MQSSESFNHYQFTLFVSCAQMDYDTTLISHHNSEYRPIYQPWQYISCSFVSIYGPFFLPPLYTSARLIFMKKSSCLYFQLLTQPAESQEEITARHHIAEQLERRFIPRSLCKSSLFAEFSNELKILKEAVHSGSGENWLNRYII